MYRFIQLNGIQSFLNSNFSLALAFLSSFNSLYSVLSIKLMNTLIALIYIKSLATKLVGCILRLQLYSISLTLLHILKI